MDWTYVMTGLDAHLSDEKVRCDVEEFFNAVGRRLDVDGEAVVFPPETRVHVVEKMLVRNPEVRGGGYFLVKSVLNPTFQDGKYTGRALSGTLKIMYDLEGGWLDEFYSRAA